MLFALVKGLVLGLLLAISVGPVVFAVIKQSLNNGIKGGFYFIAGVALSDVTLVICCNAFTEIFKTLLKYEKAIGIGGSCLLIAVGIYFLFFKKVKITDTNGEIIPISRGKYAQLLISGFFLNLFNPGVIAFWFTWATAFSAQTLTNRIIIFSTCLAVVLGTDILKVLLAGRLRNRLNQKTISIINKVSGIILIVFGIVLMWGLVFYDASLKH